MPRTQEEIQQGITGQQHIERMINKSLENLGMEYVDLYIYHMWDYQTPLYDIMKGLNRVVQAEGAVYRYFQLLCVSAGGKRRVCQVCLRAGAL